jgi:hypothetical protein
MNQSKPEINQLLNALSDNDGNASAAAKELGIPASTFRRWVSEGEVKAKKQTPTKSIRRKIVQAEKIEGVLEEDLTMKTEDEILISRGYDPDQYRVDAFNVSERDAGSAEDPKINRSYSLNLVPKPKPLIPAFEGKEIVFKYDKRSKRSKAIKGCERVVIVGDYHAPYFDPILHAKSLEHIKSYKPHRVIINGDLCDFPTVGRHRQVTDTCTAEANECIQSGGKVLVDIRKAAGPDCVIQFVPGNHDAWLNNYMIEHASAAYGICPFGEDTPAMDFAKLLKFENINIEMIGKMADWGKAFIQLTPHLVVFHGGPIDQKAGGSALKAMIDGQCAYISNHIHRLAVVGKTIWLPNGEHRTYLGAEAGCMCQMTSDGFPTYMNKPNWQQGYLTVEIEKSGHYSIDPASYQNGRLMWRGEIF